jgi:uncharacterized membrane protein YccC
MSAEAETAGTAGWLPARYLAHATLELLELDSRVEDPPEVDVGEEDFEATTKLVFGNLPGSPAVAREVAARGSRWNPLTHLDMTSRQAVQVALAGLLAILIGTAVSPSRYYWAVIAAFVTFTGTGTRSETFLKAINRVLGTLAGLVVSVVLAHVTAGSTAAVLATILGSVFLGFYLIRISYAYMIFFITIMLGQLYTVLGTFTDSVLVLRLEETAVGAGVGFLVALLVAPLSTRDTARYARDELLHALGDLLEGAASYASGDRVDLDAMSRTADDRARQLLLVSRPLTRPLLAGYRSRATRHRLGLYVAAVTQARALTVALTRRPVQEPETVATVAKALAESARRLTGTALGRPAEEAGASLERGDEALFGRAGDAGLCDPVLRHLRHLAGSLGEIAEAYRSARPTQGSRTGRSAA